MNLQMVGNRLNLAEKSTLEAQQQVRLQNERMAQRTVRDGRPASKLKNMYYHKAGENARIVNKGWIDFR